MNKKKTFTEKFPECTVEVEETAEPEVTVQIKISSPHEIIAEPVDIVTTTEMFKVNNSVLYCHRSVNKYYIVNIMPGYIDIMQKPFIFGPILFNMW